MAASKKLGEIARKWHEEARGTVEVFGPWYGHDGGWTVTLRQADFVRRGDKRFIRTTLEDAVDATLAYLDTGESEGKDDRP